MTARQKITSLVLAIMLLLSLPIYATGDNEEPETFTVVVNDIFSVALPVISRNCTVFDFIMDPQGMIEKTDAARYAEGINFRWNTLYFANLNEDGTIEGYSGMSDPLTITNRSTMSVEVTLEAWLTLPDGVVLVDEPTFEGDTTASLYMALTDGRNVYPITENGTRVTVSLPAALDAYELVYDIISDTSVYTLGDPVYGTSSDTRVIYYYTLSEQAMRAGYDGFPTYSFCLIGACNPNGNWEGLENITPNVTVQWTVTPK